VDIHMEKKELKYLEPITVINSSFIKDWKLINEDWKHFETLSRKQKKSFLTLFWVEISKIFQIYLKCTGNKTKIDKRTTLMRKLQYSKRKKYCLDMNFVLWLTYSNSFHSELEEIFA
jgi:hypothetical protein